MLFLFSWTSYIDSICSLLLAHVVFNIFIIIIIIIIIDHHFCYYYYYYYYYYYEVRVLTLSLSPTKVVWVQFPLLLVFSPTLQCFSLCTLVFPSPWFQKLIKNSWVSWYLTKTRLLNFTTSNFLDQNNPKSKLY